MPTTSQQLRLAVSGAVVDQVSAVVHRPGPPGSGGPAVFLVHGAGGDLDDLGLTALADGLASRGHVAVRANLPYREAGRRVPPRADRAVGDYHAIFAAARAELGARRAWVAGGKSYGGRVASLAAAQGMACAGLLFYGYPLHAPGKPDRVRVGHWPDVAVPCLFLQGERDPFGSPDELRAHLPGLRGGARVAAVEAGDHSLRVIGKHAADGVPRKPPEVVAGLIDVVTAWLRDLD